MPKSKYLVASAVAFLAAARTNAADISCDDIQVPDIVVQEILEIVEDLGVTQDLEEFDYGFCELYQMAVNEADQVLDLLEAQGVNLDSLGLAQINLGGSCDVDFTTVVTEFEDLLLNPFVNNSWALIQYAVPAITVSYEEVVAVTANATDTLINFLELLGHEDTTFGEACPSVCESACQPTTAGPCECGSDCTVEGGAAGLCGTDGQCAVFIVPPSCNTTTAKVITGETSTTRAVEDRSTDPVTTTTTEKANSTGRDGIAKGTTTTIPVPNSGNAFGDQVTWVATSLAASALYAFA